MSGTDKWEMGLGFFAEFLDVALVPVEALHFGFGRVFGGFVDEEG